MQKPLNLSLISSIFGNNVTLLPGVDEFFELEMAFWEFKSLSKDELIERSAYFKSIDNKKTNHYNLYSSTKNHEERSFLTQNYFESGQFSTGYATHGLFPYRGKFHPQLIKGLLNILGVKRGDFVLDPMAGSGTTNIESALMGINSIAFDVNPFARYMTQVKYDALKINIEFLKEAKIESEKLFDFFSKGQVIQKIENVNNINKKILYNLSFLAYLDALGYSKRVIRSNHKQLFDKVLKRYINSVENFVSNQYFKKEMLGNLSVLSESDALNMKLEEQSVDCIITSPPYSFAIDYIENDKDQLEFLGYNTKELKNKLIGLKGENKNEKLDLYFQDMDTYCKEVSFVLKKNHYFVLIIGSNTNQTGGIRLEESVITSAQTHSLCLIKSILKPIKGMRNTMKEEYILIFQKQ